MTDHEPQAAPVVKVAQDLRAIEGLFEAVLVQAVHKANDRLMPGGEAMVALASVGSPREWEERIEAAEHYHLATCDLLDHTRCRYAEHVADEDGHEPILQTLVFWTEQARGYDLDRRPTIATEVNFLRGWLNWAWDNLVEFDDFRRDIATARTRLENLLMAGERAQRGVPCLYEECKGRRLTRKLEPCRGDDGEKAWRWSKWMCGSCKRTWDESRYAAMVMAAHEATKFEDIDGETWGTTDYVALKVGRSQATIRQWVHKGEVATVCILSGRRVRFVSLSDARRRDADAKRRKVS